MRKFYSHFIILMFAFALTSLTLSGCGKNVVGPSAPGTLTKTTQAQAVDADAAEVVAELADDSGMDANCHGRNKKVWSRYMFRYYLFKFNPWVVNRITNQIVRKWFEDEALTKRFRKITKSRMFYIVTFRCGVGPMLFLKSLKILAKTWVPGLNTNPRNTDPEITLLPYRFRLGQGFYGERLPGWGNGNGYHVEGSTPEGDLIFLETKSFASNIFMNESPIYAIQWRYSYFPVDMSNGDIPQALRMRFTNAYWDKKMIVDDAKLEEDGARIYVDEMWASTENKSAVCKISSLNTEDLNIDLQFDELGAGGGTVDIKSWRGRINHYEFVVRANGHGYYIKNGGRKRRF
jgi:hypothetical protein